MLRFQDKRTFRRILYSPPVLAILLLVAFFTARGGWGMYQTYQSARVRADEARIRLDELENRAAFLSGEIDRLGTPSGIEEEVRGTFHVAREGEKLVIITGEEEEEIVTESKKKTVWQWFRGLFSRE